MPEYGGKRGQQSEADIVQRGGEGVVKAMQAKGEAEAQEITATGEMISKPMQQIGGIMQQRSAEERARNFEREKIGAGMAHEQGMQREKILGESALQGQQGQQRQQQLKMELDARAQEQEKEREFRAATDNKATFDKATGTYQPTEMAKAQQRADLNLTVAKRTGILGEIAENRRKSDLHFQEAKMKVGQDAAELEEKGRQSMISSIEKLADLEHHAFAAAAHEGPGDNPLAAAMASKIGPDSMSKLGMKTAPKSKEELMKFAEQMRTARNAQAFQLCSKTGDTSFIVPGSREQSIMTNRWIPQVRTLLQNNPIMSQLAMANGPQYAGKVLNMIAAQMTMMELSDPDIAAAAARAMQVESRPNAGLGQQSQPTTQPGGGAPGGGGGSGISIPRER